MIQRWTKYILLSIGAVACFLPAASMANEILEDLKTEQLLSKMQNSQWQIIDCRLNDAFNGWKLEGVQQGGHIPGAIDFSANWLKVDKKRLEKELKETLTTKGIDPEKNIVLYDANGTDAAEVATFLKKEGYNNLFYYNIKNWPVSKPLNKYPNYHLVVPAVAVHDILEGKTVETFTEGKTVKIVEASWGEEKTSYAKGHIPTTFHINTDNIEPPTETEPVMWMLADDETLTQFALKFGFQKDDVVIVTGQEQMAAYRIALVLRYIGVEDVRVLNGGTLAWTMAGYELEKESYKPVAVEYFGGSIPGNQSAIDTIDEMKANLPYPERYTLVDNRTWKEHVGEISGYSYHKIKGRIPGSVFGYAGKSDAYSLDYFRNPDKTMRNPDEIIAMWEERGIDTNTRLAFMCGSGWRAAEIYFYADVYGLEDITVYSDGWIGWSNAGNPKATGEPQK